MINAFDAASVMNCDYGHTSAAERQRIDLLEAKVANGSASERERLVLALLNLEPSHEGERAVEILRSLVDSNEIGCRALFWLAYCYVYELLAPQWLREAIAICDRALDSEAPRELKAGLLMLKATALRDLGDNAAPIPELVQSIALAPDWFSNRQLLAQVFLEQGDVQAAADQLRAALAIDPLETEGLDVPEELFEELVTARASRKVTERICEQLESIVRQTGSSPV